MERVSTTKPSAQTEPDYPSRDYQPTQAEYKKEFDMPNASMDTLRKAFFTNHKARPPQKKK